MNKIAVNTIIFVLLLYLIIVLFLVFAWVDTYVFSGIPTRPTRHNVKLTKNKLLWFKCMGVNN